ncbi:thiamine biosynthesis sulfur transfer protein [Streptomyces albus]|uniref:Thiamine biosynthesis sulfur transfer protein n=1 Tax=Streptomyces albus (strain ATCC 21838 / DSM 41398 / FERM P-419 / JCM 4703 / NBRC 107858) TaxID=1081613 RepID=A0A0B5EWH7_STRA4|nr:thiamine biosynthesis sulfur transfer protein [Streptomyces albus]AOU80450.1 thiamine biosynthesis sulfur transfer protein [Streptomyces albus]AYN36163.1 thiamine biosynthesis protein ThiS [Streptomyces albus]
MNEPAHPEPTHPDHPEPTVHTDRTGDLTPAALPDEPAPARPAGPPRLSVTVNGARRDLDPATSLGGLVAALTTAPSGVAAALNETVVPRGAWAATSLREGDRVEVLTAVQGG